MANTFYTGEKAEKSEASRRLIESVSAIYDGKFGVVFQMDDGGSHLTLLLEVEHPVPLFELQPLDVEHPIQRRLTPLP